MGSLQRQRVEASRCRIGRGIIMPYIPSVPFLTRARGSYMRGTPHGDQQQSVGRRKPRELLIIQTRRHEEEHHDQQNVKMCAILLKCRVSRDCGLIGPRKR